MTSEIRNILKNLSDLNLPYQFKSQDLLQQAFTHKSYDNEQSTSLGNNERLEFLGDAVVGLILSRELMSKYPEANEGDLSKWRASLVNENSLFELALEWKLGDFLRLGRGEVQSLGHQKPRIMASCFEAVVGAIFIDGGYDAVEPIVLEVFAKKLTTEFQVNFGDFDFKTRLQEKTQEKFKVTPSYIVKAETGPDHDKSFEVAVVVGDRELATGIGRSKKQAAQEAARKAMENL